MATILTISGGNLIPTRRPAGGITIQAGLTFGWLMQSARLNLDRCVGAVLTRTAGLSADTRVQDRRAGALVVTGGKSATLEDC